MTKFKFARIAALVAVAACGSSAFADTATLSVSASVSGVCKFVSTPAMAFTIDPSAAASASNGTATSKVQYQCTKGTAPTSFTVGGAAAAAGYSGTLTSTSPSASMAYSISWTAPTSAGLGFNNTTPIDIDLTGTIAEAVFQNAPASSYTTPAVALAINP